MIGAQALLDLARPLAVAPAPNAAVTTRVVTGLRSRRVPVEGAGSRLRYPGKPAELQGLELALDAARQSDPVEFAVLAAILRDPLRGYRTVTRDASAQSYTLLGAWSLPDGSIAIGLAEVTVRSTDDPTQRIAVTLEVLKAPVLGEVIRRLERLFSEIVPSDRLGDRHRDPADALLWVGDSGRAGAHGGGWKDKIAAPAEARGFNVAFCEQPTAFQHTHKEIARFDGSAIAVWASWAGPFTTRQSLPPKWRVQAIYLEEQELDGSIDELRLMLDEGPPAPAPPATWDDFDRRISELKSDAFVLTDRCCRSLKDNPYPDPARMWDFTERLSRAARGWRELEAEVGGRLAEWIMENHEIEVAMHDSTLGVWAEFSYEGQNYSREPHVKVDDYKDPSQCGRIYFAVDTEARRFIVDHIGLHP
jgi:hypothetical protein